MTSPLDYSANGTEASVVAALAATALEPVPIYEPGDPARVVLHDHTIIDTERYAPTPNRVRGGVSLHDIRSLVDYSVPFYAARPLGIRAYLAARDAFRPGVDAGAAPVPVSLTVLFNDDETGEQAGWCDHRAVVEFLPSEDWLRWLNGDGDRQTQERFAEFLEDNAEAIIEPDAATVLELVSNFEQTVTTTFERSVRLDNGLTRIIYREDGAGLRDVTLPRTFRIAVPVFADVDATFGLTARLKFRAQHGSLVFWYELVRPDLVFAAAVNDLEERFIDAHEGRSEFGPPVLRGEAPTATVPSR